MYKNGEQSIRRSKALLFLVSCSLLQLLSSNLPAAIGSHSCDEYQRRLTIVAAQKDYTIQQKGSRHVEVRAKHALA